MKRRLVSLLLLLGTSLRVSVSSAQSAPAIDAATRAELIAAREQVWKSWYAGDTARLDHVLPSALAAGSPNGWETRPLTIAASREFASHGARLVDLRFDSTAIMLRGRVAIMQAVYTVVVQDEGGNRRTTRGFATEVFVKEKTGWMNPFWYLDAPGT